MPNEPQGRVWTLEEAMYELAEMDAARDAALMGAKQVYDQTREAISNDPATRKRRNDIRAYVRALGGDPDVKPPKPKPEAPADGS